MTKDMTHSGAFVVGQNQKLDGKNRRSMHEKKRKICVSFFFKLSFKSKEIFDDFQFVAANICSGRLEEYRGPIVPAI